jgi:HAD superfamily hydrolase (TIGR01490 family)
MKAFQERHGVRIIQAWGMTETSPLAAVAHPVRDAQDEWEWRAHTGRITFGVETRIMGDLLRFGWQQLRFRVRGKEDLAAVAEAREKALSLVAGKSVADIVAYGEEIYDELMAERIWSGTRALAQTHLDAGQRVWLVTATPVELARIIAKRLGLTGALGTVAEVEDGLYTGRLVGEPLHGPSKAEAVKALAEREGLDLSRCTAYSDSSNDIPMLSCVGRAVAINPDTGLRTAARANGWEVRDFRTGRKAAKVGVPATAGTGLAVAAVLGGLELHRRRQRSTLAKVLHR